MREKRKEMWALAAGIALLPPLWAVLSPFIGVTTGSVALICAALYVANGNRVRDGVRITVGFLLGDLWALAAMGIMALSPLDERLELFLTLFVLGGAAVVTAHLLPKWIYLPSWLCGWAVGLTLMGGKALTELHTLPLEIAVSMAVGVWYVGYGVDLFTRLLLGRKKKGTLPETGRTK